MSRTRPFFKNHGWKKLSNVIALRMRTKPKTITFEYKTTKFIRLQKFSTFDSLKCGMPMNIYTCPICSYYLPPLWVILLGIMGQFSFHSIIVWVEVTITGLSWLEPLVLPMGRQEVVISSHHVLTGFNQSVHGSSQSWRGDDIYPFFYQFGSTTSVGNPILDLPNWVQLGYTEQYPLQKLKYY